MREENLFIEIHKANSTAHHLVSINKWPINNNENESNENSKNNQPYR